MLEQNQILGGHYRFVQALGEGGLAKTYIAEDLHRPGQPTCVVKCLKPASHDQKYMAIARRLFAREADILEKLGQHDQIPRLLAYFQDPQTQEFFLVQEYIEGHTLNQELPAEHRWSEEKILAFLQQGLAVLSYVHSFNVIHRDIKPTNLIRRDLDSGLVLIDFGAVKQINAPNDEVIDSTSRWFSTVAIGTQGYAPTEQIRGRPRLNSDIYALGMVAIQALTGIDPINLQEDDEGELIWRSYAEVSDGLANILAQMVRYHFKDRYQRSADVLTDLESLTSGLFLPKGVNSKKAQETLPETPVLQATPLLTVLQTEKTIAEPQKAARMLPINVRSDQSLVSTGGDSLHDTSGLEVSQSVLPRGVQPEPPEVRSQKLASPKRKSSKVKWGIASLVMLIGGTAFGGLSFSKNVAFNQLQQQLDTLYDQQQYAECTAVAQTAVATKKVAIAKIQEPLDRCRLGHAQQHANQQKWPEAVKLVMTIPSESSQYREVQDYVDDWSRQILEQATSLYEMQGKLDDAIATIKHIPASSSLAENIDKRMRQWQASHQTNTALIQEAEVALKNGQAEGAIATVKAIQSPEYWKQKAEQIKKQAQTQIAARPRPPRRSTAVRKRTMVRTARPQPRKAIRRKTAVKFPVRRRISVRSIPSVKSVKPVRPRRVSVARPAPRKKVVVKICPGPLCSP